MKKNIITSVIIVLTIFITVAGCSKKTEDVPCGGKGILWLENKLDSAVSVTVVQIHNTVTVDKDYTQRFDLTGNQPYQIKITGPQYYLDTTLMIQNCDNNLFVVTMPIK